MADIKAVACNYAEGTKIFSLGTKAYIVNAFWGGNLPERVCLVGKSRGGRWIEKWEATWRLVNFRLVTLTDTHPARCIYPFWFSELSDPEEVLRRFKESARGERQRRGLDTNDAYLMKEIQELRRGDGN